MREIDAMARDSTETVDAMNNVMNDSITQIKVPSLRLFPFPNSKLPRTHIPFWVIAIGTSMAIKGFLAYCTQ